MKSPPLWAAQLLSIRLLWEFADGRCRATSPFLAVIFRTPLKYHLHWAAHRTKDGWRIFQKEWSYLCFFYFWRFFFFLGLGCYKTASHITGSILSQYCKKNYFRCFLVGWDISVSLYLSVYTIWLAWHHFPQSCCPGRFPYMPNWSQNFKESQTDRLVWSRRARLIYYQSNTVLVSLLAC